MPRWKKRRFSEDWRELLRQTSGRKVRLDQLADCLLAFQFCERDPDGLPSDRARLGALWHARQSLDQRDLPKLLAAVLKRR